MTTWIECPKCGQQRTASKVARQPACPNCATTPRERLLLRIANLEQLVAVDKDFLQSTERNLRIAERHLADARAALARFDGEAEQKAMEKGDA